MKLTGTPDEIVTHIRRDAPNLMAPDAVVRAREIIAPGRAQMEDWQGAALYALARPYNRGGANILEIGTAAGFSAAVLALACPNASITTLNPAAHEVTTAARALERFTNITVLQVKSWDYLKLYRGPCLDMVWIDGDHRQVARDLPWYEWLRPHGLMLLHDYSPSACPPVWASVNTWARDRRRPADVSVLDDRQIGIVGFYRREEV